MFRKRVIPKASRNLRRQNGHDNNDNNNSSGDESEPNDATTEIGDTTNNDDDDDDTNTVSKRIQQTKKKRKWIASVQTKRGVDTKELFAPPLHAAGRTTPTATGATAGDYDNGNNEGADATSRHSNYGILDQKHRKLMEEYVNSQLDSSSCAVTGTVMSDHSNNNNNSNNKPFTKEALFAEIAQKALSWSGQGRHDSTDINNNNNNNRSSSSSVRFVEDSSNGGSGSGDGSGGGGAAVLVAGTGIAEVILPAKEHATLEQETRAAKTARYVQRRTQKADPAPARPEAIPNRFAIARSYAYDTAPAPPPPPPQNEELTMATTQGMTTTTTTTMLMAPPSGPDAVAVAEDRIGFEALKQQQQQQQHRQQHRQRQRRPPPGTGRGRGSGGRSSSSSSNLPPLHQRSNDERVFHNFVTRQRELKK